MKIIKAIIILLIVNLFFISCIDQKSSVSEEKDLQRLTTIPVLDIDFVPQKYVAYKSEEVIRVDGELSDDEWGDLEWTKEFEDLKGYIGPEPLFPTRVKMQWDDNYFYFAAELIEPHIWATLKSHDDIILRNNDFEIFIDPQNPHLRTIQMSTKQGFYFPCLLY